MFLGFAQFGKQSNNSKTTLKNRLEKAMKKHETIINKPLIFHQFSWLFQAWKMHWFFMHFSWKMGSKMEPKTILKSFKNDFGRSKGRPGPIVNVFRSKMSTWSVAFHRIFGVLFSTWFSNRPRGTPETDFDAILDASLVKNDVFLTPFWRHWWPFLSKSFKNALQNHETNIKIAKASSPNEDSKLHVND